MTFKAQTDLSGAFTCNCSFCVRRATTLLKLDPEGFELQSDKNKLSAYGNSGFSRHYFCNNCGIQCFTEITRQGAEAVIVNAACLEGIDFYSLKPSLFDGKNKL
ncbi:GFA family protein [Agaribacterium haliotis]|uniref:GFA family protein n=1 Tax=Agaribacterium haliotis TaxID=2013869 RepID=UPI001304220B|nr:GFA family protein [Agaribacterium haliotis]